MAVEVLVLSQKNYTQNRKSDILFLMVKRCKHSDTLKEMSAMHLFKATLVILIILFVVTASPLLSYETEVRFGVLANKGVENALKRWNPTADYLNQQLPGHLFKLVPLRFEEVEPAVKSENIDFILTNTSHYIELESLYGVNRILTLIDSGLTVFGGTIFCMADRNDIHSIQDLKGKTFMAVDQFSLGGWRSAWRELKEQGINPLKDLKSLEFGGSHNDVVASIMSKKADAGTVRTGTLEKLARDGKVNLKSLRILNERKYAGFPFLVSTRLYPEWPLAKLKHTSDNLSKKVSIALLHMPEDSRAAQAADISGWTIPLDYYPVHELMRELHVRPYENFGKVTIRSIIAQYWYMIITIFIVLLAMSSFLLYIGRINRRLKSMQEELQKANTFLDYHATRDALTKLYNRRRFNEFLEGEISKSHRYKTPFSLIMFDIDHFKKVNDTYGHNRGDVILKEIAQVVVGTIRKYDIFARWGGEEFMILVPNSSLEGTLLMAEKIRSAIEKYAFTEVGTVTCSFGVTEYKDGDSIDSLVIRADGALYKAKELGRNRVETN
jgi:diguanylate cyclase (GGDEF)-like protein